MLLNYQIIIVICSYGRIYLTLVDLFVFLELSKPGRNKNVATLTTYFAVLKAIISDILLILGNY